MCADRFGIILHLVQAIRRVQRVNVDGQVLSIVTRIAPSGLATAMATERCNNVALRWYTNGRSGYMRKLDRKVQQGL